MSGYKFSYGKFICELDLRANTTTQEGQTAPGNNHLVCIEIPFTTIVGINIPTAPSTATTVFIQVDTVPAMWQGTKILQQRSHGAAYARVQYDTSHTVDFTNGQLSKVPFYKITISSVGIRDHLMKFDPRFSVLMKIPIKIDSNMTPPAQRELSKPAKRKRQTSQSSTSAVSQEHSGLQNDLESNQKYQRVVQTKDSLKTCACTSGCMSKRCNCIKEGRKCESDCRCVACNNPLNILAEFGVNLAEARHDICFMQNLSKISNLRAFLQDSVETPCCDSRIPLSNCCIGIVECPECESEYRYSWCSRGLCDEESRPRNHCAICQTCRELWPQSQKYCSP